MAATDSKDPRFYPPPVFYFSVQIAGFSGARGKYDNSFQEVSGLDMSFDTETIIEGGENRFSHIVPTRRKYSNLVLKRGFIATGSALGGWCDAILGGDLTVAITLKNITVRLLAPDGGGDTALKEWEFEGAYPVRWQLADLDASQNSIAVETIEFAYKYFKPVKK